MLLSFLVALHCSDFALCSSSVLQTRDAYYNNLTIPSGLVFTISLTLQSGRSTLTGHVQDMQDGTHLATYTATVAASYKLNIQDTSFQYFPLYDVRSSPSCHRTASLCPVLLHPNSVDGF